MGFYKEVNFRTWVLMSIFLFYSSEGREKYNNRSREKGQGVKLG